jgi:hypothetical protein
MVAGFKDITAEEARSKRIAMAEDEREEVAEVQRQKEKEKRKKKRGAAAFLDD